MRASRSCTSVAVTGREARGPASLSEGLGRLPPMSDTSTFVLPTPRADKQFKVVSEFQPAGDQPRAIEQLADGIWRGERVQTLLGITGSGKSATMAWTIEQVQKPTLVIAPNKSPAAQLAHEFREFFPEKPGEYF